MDYINAFWVGGLICALTQILLDRTKMMPGRIMVLLVCSGSVLGAFKIYPVIQDFAGAGASVPLLGFGNLSVEKTKPYLVQDPQVQKRLRAASVRGSRLVDYMNHIAGFPVYENTAAKFFPLGEDMFEQLMEELKAAKHFIFMEYFIIDRGYMWDSILEVLRQKAEEGVEVRVMYDGMCCLMLLPYHYPQKLENMGIRCQMFSPIKPVLSTHQNYRQK